MLDQWPALHACFDREAENDIYRNARVQRIAMNQEVKLLCRFVSYAVEQIFSGFSNSF